MIQITPQMRILVAVEPADFRKGMDGLARLCQERLQQDPFCGCVFVFRNRRATALSKELCKAWNWVQPNGVLRDMVCRGLMLALHRAGHIELPERRRTPRNPLAQRSRPAAVKIDRVPLHRSLPALGPLHLEQVRRTPQEPLFNSLIEQHHYLGYTQPVPPTERAVRCLRSSK